MVTESGKSLQLLSRVLTSWTTWVDEGLEQQLQTLSSLTRLTCLQFRNTNSAEHLTSVEYLSMLLALDVCNYYNLEHQAISFVGLQELTLSHGQDQSCDLTYLTRLTRLKLMDPGDDFCSLTLPRGDNVSLRCLKVWGGGDDIDEETSLQQLLVSNLSYACQLTKLDMQSFAPKINSHDWPKSLCHLQFVTMRSVQLPLPSHLADWAELQQLDLSMSKIGPLLTWFSGMTQLTMLTLDHTDITNFPQSIMNLSQLQDLSMAYIEPPMVLRGEILGFSKWPGLKLLDLSVETYSWSGYDLDSKLNLLELQAQLSLSNSGCKLKIGTGSVI